MQTTRMLAGALAAVSLAAASLSMGTGTAVALPSQPHQWCPGMPMHNPPGPGAIYVWDMNVCHTWQYVKPGMGNVPFVGLHGELDHDSSVWEGPNMPPGAARECGNDGFLGIPVSC